LSAGPTDRSGRARRLLLAGLAAAGLVALPAPPRALADTPEGDGPVVFTRPDRDTARDINDYIDRFGDPSPNNREVARDRLYDIGTWAAEVLRTTLRERKSQFRTNSLLVLGRLGDRRSIPEMRRILGEDDEWPPAVAALMLGRLKDSAEPTFEAFRAALESEKKDKKRVAVCLAMAKLHRRRGEDCVPPLEKVLDADAANPSVHHAALLALGFFRTRIAEPLPDGSGFRPSARVRAALADRDGGMKLSAILALGISYNNSFHQHFVDAFRDGDRQVRLAALLCLGRSRDAETTQTLVKVLENSESSGTEQRMAAYLLGRRSASLKGDARTLDSLISIVKAPRSPDTAAACLVALGGVDDPRVVELLVPRLGAPSATIQAAAAVAAVRLVRTEDLVTARDGILRRLKVPVSDDGAKADMKAAVEEIGRILKDREDAAKGLPVKERPPLVWQEADSDDLFVVLERDERQRLFDLVNLRVIQVLGIDGLFPYRPVYDPNEPAEGLGGPGTTGASLRPRREHSVFFDQYDVRVELARRPYFLPEQDDPDAVPTPLPRGSGK
jgi:HEAT repeat protein